MRGLPTWMQCLLGPHRLHHLLQEPYSQWGKMHLRYYKRLVLQHRYPELHCLLGCHTRLYHLRSHRHNHNLHSLPDWLLHQPHHFSLLPALPHLLHQLHGNGLHSMRLEYLHQNRNQLPLYQSSLSDSGNRYEAGFLPELLQIPRQLLNLY